MHYPASDLVIDPVLIRKHDVSGPRYTSYPTADRFVEAFGAAELRQWLARRNIGGFAQPLSVYVHLPFCDTLCWYCGCNKIVTRDKSRSGQYIKYLEKEMALLAPLLGEERTIGQMHWGGGTPTFLSREADALGLGFEFRFVKAVPAGAELTLEWTITGIEHKASLGGDVVSVEGRAVDDAGIVYVTATGRNLVRRNAGRSPPQSAPPRSPDP